MKPKKTIAALDLGSSKTCVAIAGYFGEREGWKVLGHGFVPSEGIKKGRLTQHANAAKAAAQALKKAQDITKTRPTELIIALPASVYKNVWREESLSFYTKRKVQQDDLLTLSKKLSRFPRSEKVHFLKHFISKFRLDNADWKEAIPLGKEARSISVAGTIFYLDDIDAVHWQELGQTIGLDRVRFGLAAEALSRMLIPDEENSNPVLQVDLGAGLTQMTIVKDKKILRSGPLAIAGDHVSHDIMYGVNIAVGEARRLLHEHGQANGQATDDEMMLVLDDNGEEKTQVSKAYVYRIIDARVRELFSFIREKLGEWKKEGSALPKVMILGGGLSLLSGIESVAQEITGLQVLLPKNKKNVAAQIAEGLILAEQAALTPRSSLFKRSLQRIGVWCREFV
jgi:cell division protein FtsA